MAGSWQAVSHSCRNILSFCGIRHAFACQRNALSYTWFTSSTFQLAWQRASPRRTRGRGAAAPPPGLKNFRASAGCSKILNDKKYIFNTMKNSRTTLVFRASASYSKILNDKIYFNTVKNSRATLFFRASASCSKILNDKKYIFNTAGFL